TGLYMAVTFLFCGWAGRELNGRSHGALAALLLLGSFGLVVRSHQLISAIAGLAGFAMTYYGCALARRSLWGGLWLGTGVGVIFMSQGVLEAGISLLLAAVVPLIHPSWRTRVYWQSCLVAAVCAVPWITLWPLALYSRSPVLFHAWADLDLYGRFSGSYEPTFYYVGLLPWYGWPLWALGLWALWHAKQRKALDPSVALPLLGFVITLLVLSAPAEKRDLSGLPLLVPLALLAAPAANTLRRGAANAWYWFSIMGFTFFIIVGWFYWSALELGVPARLHEHLLQLQPGYATGFRLLPFVLGAAYTAVWFIVVWRTKRTPERPAVIWATGVTVIWALLAILFIAWIDVGKSYRSVMVAVRSAMPAQYHCMNSRGLGEPQRAMLEYYTGVISQRLETESRRDCDLLLIQSRPGEEHAQRGWKKIWDGGRPGDKAEHYYLYHRTRR
ncbi:MAG TPA: hypothetical protein VLN59_04955, partial [Burkholderiales bacterium]|nr:hypothetical protein [Burkholderiales bacterium]